MANFFGDNVVTILQTGFAGVSVLLMYMAYRLLADAIKSEQDIEKLKVNRTSIFGFMAFSTFVMAGALYITLTQERDHEIEVNVAFLPNEPKSLKMLDFSVAGLPVDLPNEGILKKLALKNDRAITFNLNRMNTHMNGLENNVSNLESKSASLLADKTALEADKLGLRSQLDLFMKEKVEQVLNQQHLSVSDQTREEESGA